MGKVAVEIYIAPFNLRLEFFRRWVTWIVNLEILIGLGICIDDVVDKTLVRRKTPLCARAQPHSRVFAACDVLRCALAVASPVKLAADINQAFKFHVRAIKNCANKSIVVVKLRVGRDDDPRLRVLIASWLRSARKGCKRHQGQQCCPTAKPLDGDVRNSHAHCNNLPRSIENICFNRQLATVPQSSTNSAASTTSRWLPEPGHYRKSKGATSTRLFRQKLQTCAYPAVSVWMKWILCAVSQSSNCRLDVMRPSSK